LSAILLVLPLCGCYTDQQKQQASCELQESHFAVTHGGVSDKESADNITLCMLTHGYKLVPDNCPANLRVPSAEVLEATAKASGFKPNTDEYLQAIGRIAEQHEVLQPLESTCYEPLGWGGRQTLKFEKWLGQTSD
jgi:hypothetical protein